tara:strand:- start:3834 stop:4001 length:168 start_codon:yes stop_codon:yes gene_type:complete
MNVYLTTNQIYHMTKLYDTLRDMDFNLNKEQTEVFDMILDKDEEVFPIEKTYQGA